MRCVLLTARPARRRSRDEIANGDAQIAVGTHALIQRGVEFADLAVAVVDEQHRFGVEQRKALAEGRSPHVLHMTATPIPRTLALTIYGDLSVSEIAKPPADRKPIVTGRIGAERGGRGLRAAARPSRCGRQAYVVCPLIEQSETRLARAAEAEAERLRRAELKGYRVGLLHGRLKTAERREVMRQFKERRAGRARRDDGDRGRRRRAERDDHDRAGGGPLRPRPAAPAARPRRARGRAELLPARLAGGRGAVRDGRRASQALVDTTDGFELAQIDLDLRREGQLLGTRQSGWSDLRFTRLRVDHALIERAREIAAELRDEDGPWQDEADRLHNAGEFAA